MPTPGSNIAWPTLDEYDWALMNRATTFYDREIQQGQLKVRNDGRPVRLNGGGSKYVGVYQVDDWVVRCFVVQPPNVKPPADIALRYRAITSYLKHPQHASDFAFFARPVFVEPGLSVNGQDIPFVKVKFVAQSQLLGDFLADTYTDQRATSKIAQQWHTITQRMELRQVAHGDLDMSNVLVCGGGGTSSNLSLTLIDFDGMYVPEMARNRWSAADQGHAHFQPAETGIRKFGPEMDRFSVLIIYITLIALTKNPALWENCGADPTRPLLGAEDFARLGLSNSFTRLSQERDNTELQQCLQELQNSIMQHRMPRSLDEIVRGAAFPYAVRENIQPQPPEQSPLPLYQGRAVPLPAQPEQEDKRYSPPPPIPGPVPVAPPPPPRVYPTPAPHSHSEAQKKRRQRIILAVVIIAIIAILLLIWWLLYYARLQQQGHVFLITQALLLIPRVPLPPQHSRVPARGTPIGASLRQQAHLSLTRATVRDRPYYTRMGLWSHFVYSRGDPLRSPWSLTLTLMKGTPERSGERRWRSIL